MGIRVPSPLSSGEKVAARPDEGLCPPPRCRRMSMLSEIPHLFEEVVSPNFPRSVEIRDGRKVIFRVFEVDFSRLQCFGITKRDVVTTRYLGPGPKGVSIRGHVYSPML